MSVANMSIGGKIVTMVPRILCVTVLGDHITAPQRHTTEATELIFDMRYSNLRQSRIFWMFY